jgi:hypothetical protein
VAFTAHWTPLGGRWFLAIVNELGTPVHHRRTEVRANREHPGDELVHDLGFSAYPGGYWEDEPGGWKMAVTPVPQLAERALARTPDDDYAVRSHEDPYDPQRDGEPWLRPGSRGD